MTYAANLIASANGDRALLVQRLQSCRWFADRAEQQLAAMGDKASTEVRNALLASRDESLAAAAQIDAALYVRPL
jgi:hypothetical protein